MNTHLPRRSRLVLRALKAFTATALVAAPLAAQNITWGNIAGQTTWSNGTSWTGGNAPADSTATNTAIFTAVSNAQPVLTASRSVNGIDFQLASGGASFSSNPGVTLTLGANGIDASTQLSGTNTVSVENITIGATSTWTLFSNTSNNSTSTFTVSSNLNLNGQNLTLLSNRNSAANNLGIVNLTGVISGTTGANGLQLYAGGISRNRIVITNLNSYTGVTQIRTAEVVVNSLADTGTNSALGAGGDIWLGNNASGANLTFSGLSSDGTTNRRLLFRGTATSSYTIANNSASGKVSFTSTDDIGTPVSATANALTVRFNGTNAELNTFAQQIIDRTTSGATIVQKEQAGTWLFSGNNSYTGTTTISGGTLYINGNQSSATGAVNVTNANTTLGGEGTVGGAVTINNVSFLAPGVADIGQLTLANGLTLNGGLKLEVGGSGGVKGMDFDSLIVSAGSVSFGAASTLTVDSFGGYDLTQSGSYDLYDFATAATGNFNSVKVGATDLTFGGGLWTADDITFDPASGVLTVSAIPEPSSFAILAGLCALAGTVSRRRRA